ncbi:MAG: Rid family detoxifying hydrolase [Bacteroidota bacterium]
MKKTITIPKAPKPLGPYSQAVVKNDTLYVSGQIPLDPFTSEKRFDNISTATEQVMHNIEALVQHAGFEMSDVVKCSIFLKSLDDFTAVNRIYETYFQEDPPARETIEVKKLPLDAPLEISCIAQR